MGIMSVWSIPIFKGKKYVFSYFLLLMSILSVWSISIFMKTKIYFPVNLNFVIF